MLGRYIMVVACSAALVASSAVAEDSRAPIRVNAAQQEMILEEMRDYVVALQKISGGLAAGDFEPVAEAAASMGRGRMTGERRRMAMALPEHFRMMGMSVHDDFDAIARDAEAMGDVSHTLEQVSATLAKCVGCHSAFRLELN